MQESIPRRRSMRLTGYDYAREGAYFLTICVKGRAKLFGDIIHGEMKINDKGALVEKYWCDLPKHYPHISLDAFVTMPNHIHGIIFIVGAGLKPAPTHPLPEIVRAFKTFSARAINGLRVTPGQAVWQRGYYEHVIRNDDSLNRIREYITTNPMRWDLDRENAKAHGKDEFDRWLESLSNRAKIAPGKIV